MYINIESLWCTPETNRILYVNYTSFFLKSPSAGGRLLQRALNPFVFPRPSPSVTLLSGMSFSFSCYHLVLRSTLKNIIKISQITGTSTSFTSVPADIVLPMGTTPPPLVLHHSRSLFYLLTSYFPEWRNMVKCVRGMQK